MSQLVSVAGSLQVDVFKSREVRRLSIDGSPWWVLVDLCKILELSNPSSVAERIDMEDRSKFNLGRQGETIIVNEYGLYDVILRSDKPEAKSFKKWITHEVLPSIRKTGQYGIKELSRKDLALMIVKAEEEKEQLLLINEEQKMFIEMQDDKIAEDAPKVRLAERCILADNSQDMLTVAKIIGTGRTRLFKFLREQCILMGGNLPYQEYIDKKWFEVKDKQFVKKDALINYGQTLVTGLGLQKIQELWDKHHPEQIEDSLFDLE